MSQNMMQLFKSIVLSIPTERKNVEQTMDELQKIMRGSSNFKIEFQEKQKKEQENRGKLGFFGF